MNNEKPEQRLENDPAEEAEELIDEIIDLEEYAKAGRKPPRARGYRFKVNDTVCVWERPIITGREILTQAAQIPPEEYTLRQKMTDGTPKRIGLDDKVNLREPGIEKFRSIHKGQGEGECQDRRAAPVLDHDRLFLNNYGLRWEVIVDGSIWIILYAFPLPEGYSETHVILAIRLETGYPFTPLDMMYVYPPVRRADGKIIPQADHMQALDGKQFQRWSRHRTAANPWVPGEDSLETHVYLVEEFFHAECSR